MNFLLGLLLEFNGNVGSQGGHNAELQEHSTSGNVSKVLFSFEIDIYLSKTKSLSLLIGKNREE